MELCTEQLSKESITDNPSKDFLGALKESFPQEVTKSIVDEEVVRIEKDFDDPRFNTTYTAKYKGQVVLKEISYVGPFINGFAKIKFIGTPFQDNPKFGFINTKGELVVQCEYEWVSDFRNNFAIARISSSGKLGLIDTKGRVLIPFECDCIASAKNGNLYDYDINVDNSFNQSTITYVINGIEHPANSITGKPIDFRNGYGIIKEHGLFGIFREDLSEIIPCRYKWIVRINEAEFLLRDNEKLIYYNAETGEYIS